MNTFPTCQTPSDQPGPARRLRLAMPFGRIAEPMLRRDRAWRGRQRPELTGLLGACASRLHLLAQVVLHALLETAGAQHRCSAPPRFSSR